MQANTAQTVSVFGVSYSTGTVADAMKYIDNAVNAATDKTTFCAFVNADCLNQAYTNPKYAQVLQEADMVWADGIGVAIAARHAGTPVQENVNGTDMFPILCQKGYRLFLLGGRPGIATKAMERSKEQFPNAVFVGVHDGYFSAEETPQVLAEINAARPDILLVGFGVPRQEFWIQKHLPQLNCKLAIGVGGLFDFASGRIPRAPMWMRKIKFEWLYRLYQEPIRLFRRYVIGNPLFLFRVYFKERGPLRKDKK